MLRGITATVWHPITETDRFGNDVAERWTSETVENVLVEPASTTDMEAARPDGAIVDMTLHFPKSYSGDLRGCKVTLPSPWDIGEYRVIGNPRPLIDALTPTRWHMSAEVTWSDG